MKYNGLTIYRYRITATMRVDLCSLTHYSPCLLFIGVRDPFGFRIVATLFDLLTDQSCL